MNSKHFLALPGAWYVILAAAIAAVALDLLTGGNVLVALGLGR